MAQQRFGCKEVYMMAELQGPDLGHPFVCTFETGSRGVRHVK